MKTALLITAVFFGLFITEARAQGGYGTPCSPVGCADCCINPFPAPASEYLSVECVQSYCANDCNFPCKQIRIRNMYTCKNIVKVTFYGSKIYGKKYVVCNAIQHQDGYDTDPCYDQMWQTPDHNLPGSYDASQSWSTTPCTFWTSNGAPIGEKWWITPKASPCPQGAGNGWWIYIDFCGEDLACDKITWEVQFSYGSICSINMANIPTCCP